MPLAQGGSAVQGDVAPAAELAEPFSCDSGNISSSSQDNKDYISEDEHIQKLEESGALNQVAGSQSILSQELQDHQHSLPPASEEAEPDNHSTNGSVGLSQNSNLDMSGFSQISIEHHFGDDSQKSETVFDSQKAARKYGLLSQDPFALPSRSLNEPPLSQRSTASAESTSNHSLLPPPDSQGSSNSESCFGSLLDAVQLFQSQEAEEERLQLSQGSAIGRDHQDVKYASHGQKKRKTGKLSSSSPGEENKRSDRGTSGQTSTAAPGAASTTRHDGNGKLPSHRKPKLPLAKKNVNNSSVAKSQPMPSDFARSVSKNSLRNGIQAPGRANAMNTAMNAVIPQASSAVMKITTSKTAASNGYSKSRRKTDGDIAKQQKLAERAAALAQRTINDADLAKRLLLSMALTRENPRSAPEKLPGPGFVLPPGFFWAHYPPLEKGTCFVL